MMEKHGVFYGTFDGDAMDAPEVLDIIGSVVEDFGPRACQGVADGFPGRHFASMGMPVGSGRRLPKGDHEGELG